jgi:hypothetical protein
VTPPVTKKRNGPISKIRRRSDEYRIEMLKEDSVSVVPYEFPTRG